MLFSSVPSSSELVSGLSPTLCASSGWPSGVHVHVHVNDDHEVPLSAQNLILTANPFWQHPSPLLSAARKPAQADAAQSTPTSSPNTSSSSGRRPPRLSLPPSPTLRMLSALQFHTTRVPVSNYQLDGLSFLVDMYQHDAVTFAWIKEREDGPLDPHLVICPLSVLSAWMSEAARWLPSFRVVRFQGEKSERDRLKKSLAGNFDIIVTTYDAYEREHTWFKSRRWTYCVLDEGHKIKNADAMISQHVQGIGSLYRLILTGTPVQNNLSELWGLLHCLEFVDASRQLLKHIMIRRTKANVDISVPPRQETTVFIPFTEMQRFWTLRMLTKLSAPDLGDIFKSQFGDVSNGRAQWCTEIENQIQKEVDAPETKQWNRLTFLLLQLRRICDHPYLLAGAEPEPYLIGEHLVAASSKLVIIDKLLADILPKGERVLIFTQWTGMLDLLEDFMNLRGIAYARLDGSTNRARRTLYIKLFQQDDSPYKVFLISTKAGGLGINLTKASHVIMCDSDWNPQNDLQAIARAHRIGQTKIVQVYRLICRGSVEDQMLDRIRRKLFLSVKIMGSDNASSDAQEGKLGLMELMDILRNGSSALANSEDGMSLDQLLANPISEILAASRTRQEVRNAKLQRTLGADNEDAGDAHLLQDAMEEERRLLSGVAQVRCRLFEGKMVHHTANNHEIAREWSELEKRARIDRTVTIHGMTFLPPITESATVTPSATSTRKKMKSSEDTHEDWCLYCRDGGELVLCHFCPRVFHAACTGYTDAEIRRASFMACGQHACAKCFRNTGQAGGMLFKCRTCPNAFCEDCLPSGDIEAIGEVLPEFEILGHAQKTSSFYIRCEDCCRHFAKYPAEWKERQEEFRIAEEKLKALSFHVS
ncbi:hypothetical protein EW146_g4141 [Bondarzewia mesenterica]|uniref:Uncharacterized protein n=1 Tax=Bondarzewia mesenterica TaxID=1095465 RepID=A0A4S4LWH5_9AGAM|nr:hypothetical protein EW146_g4141 [Bondarzewia mesenterica]